MEMTRWWWVEGWTANGKGTRRHPRLPRDALVTRFSFLSRDNLSNSESIHRNRSTGAVSRHGGVPENRILLIPVGPLLHRLGVLSMRIQFLRNESNMKREKLRRRFRKQKETRRKSLRPPSSLQGRRTFICANV